MTDAQWEVFSYEAVIAAAVLYFVAMLSYFVEWAALRRSEVAAEHEGREGTVAVMTRVHRSRKVEVAGRLGLVLTVFAAVVHLVALVGRGALVAGIAPAQSALEQHFRDAVGEVAA